MNIYENKLLETEEYLSHSFAEWMENMGGKQMVGRIYGLLIAQAQPISLSNIAKKLKVSKPAISNTIKFVLHFNLIKKVFNPDSPREDYYVINNDSMQSIVEAELSHLLSMDDKFKYAIEILKIKDEPIEDNNSQIAKENHQVIYNQLNYLHSAMVIFYDEYIEMGKKVKEKLLILKESNK